MKENDELIELLLRTDEPDARRELNELNVCATTPPPAK